MNLLLNQRAFWLLLLSFLAFLVVRVFVLTNDVTTFIDEIWE